ncbi:unnamed protein product [Prorocentrum cordatum]|uniref:SGNH domain-containing protein n=1 Tax=Prorocentrum cordatum TaxID=2364126 RepID=A0ABN9QKG4_9DINO|nr:unnamed protein product [Polarella glacialis]
MALLLLGSSFWFVTPEAMGFPFPGAVLPVAGAVCFIVAGQSHDSLLNHSILGGTVPVHIGKLSYPLYLWHWPVLCFAREFSSADSASPAGRFVLASITFAVSALTYHFVEAGFRSWRPSRHQSVFAAMMPASLALVACLLLLSWPLLRTPLFEALLSWSSPVPRFDIEAYGRLKTPHIQLPSTGCACTRAPEFFHAPPAAVNDSRPDLPSCFDLSYSVAPKACWAPLAHCGGGWLCQGETHCRLPRTDPQRRCSREPNLSKARVEIVGMMSHCLEPSADPQRKPVLFLLGDSHSQRLFPGLSLALRGEFDIHTWASIGARLMVNTDSWSGVRTELQQIVARTLRPGDVVAISFFMKRDDKEWIGKYLSFLEEWGAIVKSKGAALVAFGDQYKFLTTDNPLRCRVMPMIQPPYCFPARSEVMQNPVLVAMRAGSDWLYFGVEGLFCGIESCGPFIPKTDYLAYSDTHHLNTAASSYLAPFICSFFREHGLFDGVR